MTVNLQSNWLSKAYTDTVYMYACMYILIFILICKNQKNI